MQKPRPRAVSGESARTLALRVLLAGGGQAALDAALRESDLQNKDRALLTTLVYGTLKWRRSLDWSLRQYLVRPTAKLSPELHWTLLLGAFQLLYLDKIPAHSAVDESVKLARKSGHAGTAGLANAVLRKLSAAPVRPPKPKPGDPPATFADYASLPDWIAEHFLHRFGPERALRIAEGVNRTPRRAVRVNERVATVPETIAALERAGVTVSRSRYGIPECLVLEATPAGSAALLTRLIGSGRLTMQSEESQLAVHLLDPKPGQTVFDVCAGRGVKSGAIAQRGAQLYAVDDDARKLAALRQEMVRLGIEGVNSIKADASKTYPVGLPAEADLVLIDSPCSGIGTLGRRAELRWSKDAGDPARLARTQRAILRQSARAVKAGGRMLYVTCSTDPREDENVVDKFLAEQSNWRSVPLRVEAPAGAVLQIGNYLLAVPGVDGADGFFYAQLERTA